MNRLDTWADHWATTIATTAIAAAIALIAWLQWRTDGLLVALLCGLLAVTLDRINLLSRVAAIEAHITGTEPPSTGRHRKRPS